MKHPVHRRQPGNKISHKKEVYKFQKKIERKLKPGIFSLQFDGNRILSLEGFKIGNGILENLTGRLELVMEQQIRSPAHPGNNLENIVLTDIQLFDQAHSLLILRNGLLRTGRAQRAKGHPCK